MKFSLGPDGLLLLLLLLWWWWWWWCFFLPGKKSHVLIIQDEHLILRGCQVEAIVVRIYKPKT